MSNEAEAVLNAALALPAAAREEIAGRLLRSLDDEPDVEPSPEQVAEIERRVEAVRQGKAKLVPAEEVFDSGLEDIRARKRP